MERLNLQPYKYNNVNITGFRLVDTSFPSVAHYLKKWNFNIAGNKGPGHPLYVWHSSSDTLFEKLHRERFLNLKFVSNSFL